MYVKTVYGHMEPFFVLNELQNSWVVSSQLGLYVIYIIL